MEKSRKGMPQKQNSMMTELSNNHHSGGTLSMAVH